MKKKTGVFVIAIMLLLSSCSSASNSKTIDLTQSTEDYTHEESLLEIDSGLNDTSSDLNGETTQNQILKVVSGDGFEVYLTDKHLIYFIGSNENWVLSDAFPEVIYDPIQIPFKEDIVDVYAGNTSIAFVGKSNKIYYVGGDMLDNLNAMTGTRRIYPPEELGIIEGIKDITLSGFTCHVLTHNGEVYAMGMNVNGTLGLEGDVVSEFTTIPFQEKISSISEGLGGTLFVSESGNLYGCGVIFGKEYERIIKPEKLMSGVKQGSVTDLTAFSLTNNGEVYAIGSNYRGEAGVQTKETAIRDFIKVDIGEKIKQVYSSEYNYTLLSSESGSLYMLGNSEENSNTTTHPEKLDVDMKEYERIEMSGKSFFVNTGDKWLFCDNEKTSAASKDSAAFSEVVLEGIN